MILNKLKRKYYYWLVEAFLKKAKVVTDMENDKITILDKKIDLYFSTSGHYCIDIYLKNGEKNNYEEVMILEKDLSDSKKKSQVI